MPDSYIFTGQSIKSIRTKKLWFYLNMFVSIEGEKKKNLCICFMKPLLLKPDKIGWYGKIKFQNLTHIFVAKIRSIVK